VENGSKGVQAAKAGQIDLVIMDVGLPDIDGRESVRILRKNGFKAPIIVLTGHNTDSDTILGLESGANDYVTKPFRIAVGRPLSLSRSPGWCVLDCPVRPCASCSRSS
jgi:DNA-binding response OmpR family regulator